MTSHLEAPGDMGAGKARARVMSAVRDDRYDRGFMALDDFEAAVRAQVAEEVQRLVAENGRMKAALEAIDSYQMPHHFPTEEERAEYMTCPECTRRRENPYFPGNHCDSHYRVMVMKYERLNENERQYNTASNMRGIARAALEPFKAVPTAVSEEVVNDGR